MTAPETPDELRARLGTGWQADGSYIPCPDCNWTPRVERNPFPGVPIHMPGTTHFNDCSTVPRPSRQDAEALQAKLDEFDRVRRRGAAEARNFWIG